MSGSVQLVVLDDLGQVQEGRIEVVKERTCLLPLPYSQVEAECREVLPIEVSAVRDLRLSGKTYMAPW